jgi:glycine cleavage system aminomethyltransferase T
LSESQASSLKGAELTAEDGKKAGWITSVTISPALEKAIALAYVRYEHLPAGTKLQAGEYEAEVTALPFL